MMELSDFVSVCEFPKMEYEEALGLLKRKEWPLLKNTLHESTMDVQPYLHDYVNAFQRRQAADRLYDSFFFDPTDVKTSGVNMGHMNALRIKTAQAKWYEDWTYRTLRFVMLGAEIEDADDE